MILRSITKHIKDQNWFAVWIDFAIVVVGVFIGIQVANWNELQAERDQAQRTLSAVLTDLSALREELSATRAHHVDTAIAIDALLDSLESDIDMEPGRVKEVIRRATVLSVLPNPPAALDDLLVAARLDLLDTVVLRDALRALAKEAEDSAGFQTESLKIFNAALGELYLYVSLDRTPGFEGRQYDIRAIDIDAIWADDQARTALTQLYVFHSNLQLTMKGFVNAIDAVFAEASDVPEPQKNLGSLP